MTDKIMYYKQFVHSPKRSTFSCSIQLFGTLSQNSNCLRRLRFCSAVGVDTSDVDGADDSVFVVADLFFFFLIYFLLYDNH